jgi:hypothetical protein
MYQHSKIHEKFFLRFGHRLAKCVDHTYKMITDWNKFLNKLHVNGQITGNQVQNLGLKVMSETQIFDGKNSLSASINIELRELLGRALPYKIQFDEFTQSIYDNQLDTIVDLVNCDKEVEKEFAREIELDLIIAKRCAALKKV